MSGVVSVLLIVLGVGQLSAAHWQLWGASLVGSNRWIGYGVGIVLIVGGVMLLPANPYVLMWTPLAGVLVVTILLLGGSLIAPPPHPDILFSAEHPAHEGCQFVQIPDDGDLMPGLLLYPPEGPGEAAVCVVPGAGDTKTFFKWRLVKALLAQGLTVLTIDSHGHGDYRHRPLVYPDCLSVVSSAVEFLRAQSGIERVGLLGISLGGAITVNALAEQAELDLDALAVVATPVELDYTRALFYREVWNTVYGSPVLSLLQETTIKQIRESWRSGGYRSTHSTSELFTLLQPLHRIRQLKKMPTLLVYSRCDAVAPSGHALAMRQAVPHAAYIESKKASHVMLTLSLEINRDIARWFKMHL